jgi:hypothetical protein
MVVNSKIVHLTSQKRGKESINLSYASETEHHDNSDVKGVRSIHSQLPLLDTGTNFAPLTRRFTFQERAPDNLSTITITVLD